MSEPVVPTRQEFDERLTIRNLTWLSKTLPDHLWIYVINGTLLLMRKAADGSLQLGEAYIVGKFSIAAYRNVPRRSKKRTGGG